MDNKSIIKVSQTTQYSIYFEIIRTVGHFCQMLNFILILSFYPIGRSSRKQVILLYVIFA